MLNIVSYNINGIRAALRKDFLGWLKVFNPDIVCLQEIKANTDQFDSSVFDELGYYNYWFSAQKKGYSGVGILSKIKPNNIEYGTGIDYMDFEGRNLRADFDPRLEFLALLRSMCLDRPRDQDRQKRLPKPRRCRG